MGYHILGRPFLATRKAQINVQEGELKLRVHEDEVTLHVFQATKHPDDEPNDDIQKCHPKEIMQSDVINRKYKFNATHKETERVNVRKTRYSIRLEQCSGALWSFFSNSSLF